ncbi:uncharacterized protein LOC126851197 [Cataglyphis hispanica]|uniref:uncharacterized protein LOC126851197 n=1 Tax=Cataglyphis hispanica TaxID=1086592 RepID=UPI0021808FF4|nr:uncharacterized protein LOC126851197 [Cataglyphis hispanica]XP_050450862.1 uncharacterized protein LOC126851197 [Cataglyphis hispanica]
MDPEDEVRRGKTSRLPEREHHCRSDVEDFTRYVLHICCYNMAYTVVYFIDDDLTSEIPTNWLHKDRNNYMCWWLPPNTKNTKSLIIKRTELNIKAWMLFSINIEKYYEYENYTSAEDSQLGKKYRKKIPPSRYISPDDIDSLSDDERNNDNKRNNSVNVQFTKGSCKKKSNKDLHADTIDTQENDNKQLKATQANYQSDLLL